MNSIEKFVIGSLRRTPITKTFNRDTQTLSILIYHRVLPEKDYLRPYEPTHAEFEWQMELIARYFSPLDLMEAITRLSARDLPKNAVCVTFDDGYADNESIALPILKKWDIPATIFVATGFLNGKRMWNDTIIESVRLYSGDTIDLEPVGLGRFDMTSVGSRQLVAEEMIKAIKYRPVEERNALVAHIQSKVKALPDDLMLTNGQLTSMHRQGIRIGAHTVNHPILNRVTDSEARTEIKLGKNQLESILDSDISLFAYPNGRYGEDYNDKHREIVSELGFVAAVSTDKGVTNATTDPFSLPRFTPWDKTPLRFYLRMLTNSGSG